MHTRRAQKYFIFLNILATLRQHPRLQQHQQIATIIVSATSMADDITTQTTMQALSDFASVRVAAVTKGGGPAFARTTSAFAFVDEVLPHNDSVATTTMLHAKAIDSNANNSNNNVKYNNSEDFAQLIERKLQEEQKATAASASLTVNAAAPPDRLLSRKRRYLIFPEGSSFQVVYDGIYGIVDYTNYLILGITVALAWELPSKPQGEVIEEIATRLREPTNDLRRNDTATHITYVDTKAKPTQTPKQQNLQPSKSLQPNYINLMTLTNPAARKSDSQYYYMKADRLPAAFHVPMHQKYYYYKGSNQYDYNNKKYHMLQRPKDSYYRTQVARPIGGYYREQPNDWRRKDQYYYGGGNKNKFYKSNNNNNLKTLKVHPFNKWTSQQQQQRTSSLRSYKPQAQSGNVQYPWWNLRSRLSNSLRRKPIPSRRIDSGSSQPMQQRQQKQQQGSAKQQQQLRQQEQVQQKQKQAASGFYQQPPATARKHRIYPVFGKRSIADEPATAHSAAAMHNNNNSNNNNSHTTNHGEEQESTPHRRYRRSGIAGNELSRMERIHVRHHRRTRQTLYEKIEKYLDKLEIANSHHCILRALCETGQKSKELAPGTFVGELMRAVFTMPEALDEDIMENRMHYKEKRFDTANAFQGSCAEEYALCQKSLWESEFVQ
ncbi:uncharacterized protein LOC105217751 [Zeugodacus cucurbitae]|uniref:Translation initiation factor IF-2 n=1 Tax=Zeugodacus cucurbitae TaxID=28588 RepID=A0A0A1WKI8_ZEUCU|nr:uncharacterized protein LOC105217751 [Zeugodacus cucurbitae]